MRAIDGNNFKINGDMDNPSYLDYNIFGLHKKHTITKGELLCVDYYKYHDGTTYSDLVVKEERTYNRTPLGLVISRNQTSTWYLEDDSVGLIKETTKYYSMQSSIDEAITRRKNITAEAKIYCLTHFGELNAISLLLSLKSQIELFESGYTPPLREAITNSSEAFITQQDKDAIVAILTY